MRNEVRSDVWGKKRKGKHPSLRLPRQEMNADNSIPKRPVNKKTNREVNNQLASHVLNADRKMVLAKMQT